MACFKIYFRAGSVFSGVASSLFKVCSGVLAGSLGFIVYLVLVQV